MRILDKLLTTTATHSSFLRLGPFTATIQTRFKKPANTAQTRLETRTLDPKLDLLAHQHSRLSLILALHDLVSSKKRGPFVSLQLLHKWAPHVGLKTLSATELVHKYPHVFDVFTHPVRKNLCCKFTSVFVDLLELEHEVVRDMEEGNVIKLMKILRMSVNGRVHLHAIRLTRKELGLPEDFRDSIIGKYSGVFRLVDLEVVELVDWDVDGGGLKYSAEVEKWREKEYSDKWLSEFETKYAFPVSFPTGFRIVPRFRERLRNWQVLSYVKPYERTGKDQVRGVERCEKRAVAIVHELLCLTVEKMVEVERLAHFRKDFGIEVNLREVLLKHPGIFYISTRGNAQTVFLREVYSKGCLVETNEAYEVRRKMLELIRLGSRNTRELRESKEDEGDRKDVVSNENGGVAKDGDFVLEILEGNSGYN